MNSQAQPTVVPYGAPAGSVTPPQGSFTQGDQPTIGQQPVPGGDPDQFKQMLIKVLTAASQQKQMPTPVPAPVPQAQQNSAPSGINQRGAAKRAIIPTISNLIQQGVAQHKQKQLAQAESDWNNLVSAMNSNNPNALNFILTDDKKLKNMAKALNQDWLNPEKTTVYKQALDNVMKQQEQKGQAAEGLKGLFQKLIHKANNPQLSDQQKMDIAKEIMARAPVTSPTLDPSKAATMFKDVAEGEKALKGEDPKTLEDAWIRSVKTEKGRLPTTSEIETHYEAERTKPIDAIINAGLDAAKNGDTEGAKQLFGMAQQAAAAKKVPPQMNSIGLIMAANKGDPDAIAALKKQFDMQKELATARGAGYGAGRAQYQIGAYIDEQGNIVPMSAFDAVQAIKGGRQLTPSGRLNPQTAIAAQRLVSEATPAITEVGKNLKTFDNAGDRAIFARILKDSGSPSYGGESEWMGTILNQALTENLSPEGKALVVRVRRLNDTMGTLRATLGLPATDRMMSMTMAMIPGPATPDSKMAGDQLDQLKQMVSNAIQIPALRGVAGKSGAGQPSGAGAPPVNLLKEGVQTTFKNGQTWTLQGGKPVQVQAQ
jgi:hypothetical protein